MWGNYMPQNMQQPQLAKPQLNQPTNLQNQPQWPYNGNMQYPNYNPNIYQPNPNQPNQIQQINVQDNQKNLQKNPVNPNINPMGIQPVPQQQLPRGPQYPNNYSNVPKQTVMQQVNKPNNNGVDVPQPLRNIKEPPVQINPQTGYPIPQQPFNQVSQNTVQPQVNYNQYGQIIPPQANIRTNPQQQQAKNIQQYNVSKMTVNQKQVQAPLNKVEPINVSNMQLTSPQQVIMPSAVDQLYQQNNEDDYFQYILMYGFRSRKGFQAGNPGKVNQDAIVISTNLKEQTSDHYFGVCDGHGSAGHDVSGFLKDNIPVLLNEINSQNNVKEQLFKVYSKLGQKLATEATFDLNFSGSTCVGCYLSHNKLYCCNVGDSRAVLGRFNNGKWSAQALSEDQKATQGSSQAMRIIKAGGHIEPVKDFQNKFVGVPRVWLKGQNFPGLAMTRSFGDLIAAGVGVINVPQIKQFTLTKQDKILVIGSDGLWQFLTDQNVIDLVYPYYEKKQFQQACSRLLQFALNVWNTQHPDTIDDISFIVAFLDYDVEQL